MTPVAEMNALSQIGEIRRLFITLTTCLFHTPPSTLAVISAERGEGKTSTVAGLAVAAARHRDHRVLAIDLNWHAPALHHYFGLSLHNNRGVLADTDDIATVANPSGIANLDIVPAGVLVPNVDPLHDETKLGLALMAKARSSYDIILVDTVSVFPVNRRMIDPVEIAKSADGAALVVLTGVTSRQNAKQAAVMVSTAGAKLVGFVSNNKMNPLA